MPQIIEMRRLIRPQLFTFDRSVDGPFCFYAPINGDRPNTVFPLIDRRRAHAEDVGRSIPATQDFDDATEGFVGNHTRKTKALLSNNQALLQKRPDKHTSLMESALDLAKRLRTGQAEAGVTDAQIAKTCGVSVQAVGQWRKTGRLHKRNLPKIAKLIGKSVDWLLGNPEVKIELLTEFRALSGQLKQIALRQMRSLREPSDTVIRAHTLHEQSSPYGNERPARKPKKKAGANGTNAKPVKLL